jgi:hypothetical protein
MKYLETNTQKNKAPVRRNGRKAAVVKKSASSASSASRGLHGGRRKPV